MALGTAQSVTAPKAHPKDWDDGDVVAILTLSSTGVIRTAASGQRIEITAAGNDRITFYSGDADEVTAAFIQSAVDGGVPVFKIEGPVYSPLGYPFTAYISVRGGLLTLAAITSDAIGSTSGIYEVGPTALGPATDNDKDSGTATDSWRRVYTYALYDEADTLRWDLSGPITAAAGDASAPAFSYSADSDTGMYRPGADRIGFSCGGTGQVSIDDGLFKPITDNDIDLGTSALSFKNIYAHAIYDEGGNLRMDLSAMSYGANDSGGSGLRALCVPNV